jgi:RNA polymerase sigma-70 factor (ECF subfamily)
MATSDPQTFVRRHAVLATSGQRNVPGADRIATICGVEPIPEGISSLSGAGAAVADRSLAARLAAGDPAALADAFREYGGVVFGVCRRVLRDARMAEDVTQDVFVFLWQHPERFDPERGSLRAWLGLLARARSIDRVRAEERRARREEASGPVVGRDDFDDAVAVSWLSSAVRDALRQLPAEQRDAVVLAYYGDRTYRQVATELDIPEGTAKSRLRLAMAKLNTILSAQLAEAETRAWT